LIRAIILPEKVFSNDDFFNMNYLNNFQLDLSRNKLTKIYSSFIQLIQLVNLTKLNVSSNNIESLSNDFFSSFKKLKSINLSFNNFSNININLANNNQEEISINLSSNLIDDFSNITILQKK
jgi:Leucine-rich repeat (LRR) protein